MDTSSRQQTNMETVDFSNITEYKDTLLKSRKIHIFPSAPKAFSKIDHMLWKLLDKFKMIEITSNFFSNHDNVKTEIKRNCKINSQICKNLTAYI